MVCFRQGKLFYVTSTTVTSTHTTSTLCFMKQSCQSSPPFDTPGGVATPGGGAKMCSTGCGCAPAPVMCPQAPPCRLPGDVAGNPACPAGCVRLPAVGAAVGLPGPDPCNSCTVTNSMADMMIPPCPGRKKKRAILESVLFEGFNISPSPSSQGDIAR